MTRLTGIFLLTVCSCSPTAKDDDEPIMGSTDHGVRVLDRSITGAEPRIHGL